MEDSEKTFTPVSRFVRYNHSEKGKATRWRYRQSPEGILSEYGRRQSRKRREYMCEYNKQWWGEHPDYKRELYHRLQDEAGCHSRPEGFYPGFRMIKALETAEVITI